MEIIDKKTCIEGMPTDDEELLPTKTHIVEWGDKHKFFTKNKKRAELFAYDKAFYFTVKLNGIIFDRRF